MDRQLMRIPVDSAGTEICVEVAGTGPAIVFVHGLTLDHRMWSDQIAYFGQTHRVIALDLRGYGRSGQPTPGTPYSHAADIASVLESLEVERAAIVGLSMGGWPAVDFALAYPAATDALVLVDSTLYGFQFSPSYGGRLAALFSNWAGDTAAAQRAWMADPLFQGSHGNPAIVARLAEMVTECHAFQLTNPGEDPHLPPVRPVTERLAEIVAPTLVLVGEHDIPDFHEIAAILHRGIPGSRFVVLPDAGHMSNMDNPALFNEVVGSFLARTNQSKIHP